MNNPFKLLLMGSALAAFLFSGTAIAQQAPSKAPQTKSQSTKATPAAAPTEKEIADAQAKGLVWVNTDTKVYHKGGQYYGKTKNGKFMTESDAKKAGYREAKESTSKKKGG